VAVQTRQDPVPQRAAHGSGIVKGHQNWVKVAGEHLTFPRDDTQSKHGVLHYIEVTEEAVLELA
jgi:hypothetical protein